jgi:hypothetical protein
MQSITSESYLINILSKLQVKQTILLLAAAVIVPLLIHLIPAVNGQPAGAYLLPIFYAPLIAVLFFRFHTAFITAVFSPVMNYLITGNPHFQLVLTMSLELAVFVIVCYFLSKINTLRIITGVAAYAATILILFALLPVIKILPPNAVSGFLLNSVSAGIPGVIIIAAINIAAVKFFKNK